VALTTISSADVPHAHHDTVHHAHFPLISFSVPELLKTKGQVVVLTSVGAQTRFPTASEYCTSKFAINRLTEFVAVGKAFFFVHLKFAWVLNASSYLSRVS
jgi:NAD(P)-dependent dehydrogenase (short-subunit alcohol dehydrogenase family)